MVGLGPGGLDIWDPILKGMGILRGNPESIPKPPGPKP